ncbi:MAG: hypothetical protein ACREJC_10905 [Tepidisphaeraceae bacterium]
MRLEPIMHEYWCGSNQLLGVNETLHQVGMIDDRWFSEESAWRGHEVHASLTDAVEGRGGAGGYVESFYGAFPLPMRAVTLATELLVCYEHEPCAGTVDWFVCLDDALWVIDWKSGVELRWHALQTAGYVGAFRGLSLPDYPITRIRRGSLYLHEDGTPATARSHYRPRDFGLFQSALACASFARLGTT